MSKTDRHYAMQWHGLDPFHRANCCPTCGLDYVRDFEADCRVHRARHREVLKVYEPRPLAMLAALYAEHGPFIPVSRAGTPLRLRRVLAGIARMFQREGGYDFAPYSAGRCDDGNFHWLIVSSEGRAIGGLSVTWTNYQDAPPRWEWNWVWVIPSQRRSGWMLRCWTMVRNLFPEVESQRPLSIPSATFFAKRDDVPDRIRKHASAVLSR